MSITEQVERLTLAAYSQLYEQEGPFEITNGERKSLMPPVAIHGLIIRALFRLLDAHCSTNKLGEVITEMPFVIMYDSKWVKGSRVPDLMFFAAVRWQEYINNTENWMSKPFVIVPDLAIEVVSANDLYTDIQDKVDRYLNDGVKLIWIVDPHHSRITVYDAERYTILGENDKLTGGDVLTGLSIRLSELFEITKK
jgi:Uma2 family endonuclease